MRACSPACSTRLGRILRDRGDERSSTGHSLEGSREQGCAHAPHTTHCTAHCTHWQCNAGRSMKQRRKGGREGLRKPPHREPARYTANVSSHIHTGPPWQDYPG